MTLLVKAAKESGLNAKFYTFYGYGFKTERFLPLADTALANSCRMKRPE